MRLSRLVLSFLLAPTLWCADGPWKERFSITIAGEERTMVVHGGGTWLLLVPQDAGKTALLTGRKEVVLESKCLRDRTDAGRLYVNLGSFPGWTGEGPASLWSTSLEMDNLYVYGVLESAEGTSPHLTVSRIEPAPSDAQTIAEHMAPIDASDWAARIKASEWVRSRASIQPNQEFWLSAADGVISQVVDDACAKAALTSDLVLLDQAVTWCVDLLHDVPRGGRIASAPWVRNATGPTADNLARRLRRLGLEPYREMWRPRSESLALEFEDRFQAIGWRDAEAFYRLGRWADVNGEFLPQAKDRSYRCYQAGLKADPSHAGIRNELGLPVDGKTDATTASAVTGDYLHHATGIHVPMPEGWKRGDRIEGDVTWIDPSSETAYLTVSVIRTPEQGDFEPLWATQTGSLQSKEGFETISTEDPAFAHGTARLMRYRVKEGAYTRQAEILLAINPQSHTGVRLTASFADEEAASVHRLLMIAFERMNIPNQVANPEPAAKP